MPNLQIPATANSYGGNARTTYQISIAQAPTCAYRVREAAVGTRFRQRVGAVFLVEAPGGPKNVFRARAADRRGPCKLLTVLKLFGGTTASQTVSRVQLIQALSTLSAASSLTASMSALGGKADMAFCIAHVCF